MNHGDQVHRASFNMRGKREAFLMLKPAAQEFEKCGGSHPALPDVTTVPSTAAVRSFFRVNQAYAGMR